MGRLSWDETFIEVAKTFAKRSRCSRAQVGAVIVNSQNRVVATGYNGPAEQDSQAYSESCKDWCSRSSMSVTEDVGYGLSCPSIHAEANALLYSSRHDVEGSTMYLTHAPCADCAKLISNSGISRLIIGSHIEQHRPNTVPYLTSCGIEVSVLHEAP